MDNIEKIFLLDEKQNIIQYQQMEYTNDIGFIYVPSNCKMITYCKHTKHSQSNCQNCKKLSNTTFNINYNSNSISNIISYSDFLNFYQSFFDPNIDPFPNETITDIFLYESKISYYINPTYQKVLNDNTHLNSDIFQKIQHIINTLFKFYTMRENLNKKDIDYNKNYSFYTKKCCLLIDLLIAELPLQESEYIDTMINSNV